MRLVIQKVRSAAVTSRGELLGQIGRGLLVFVVAKGNRPSFTEAADPREAEALYDGMIRYLRTVAPAAVETGRFGAQMEVELVNDEPVTILLER